MASGSGAAGRTGFGSDIACATLAKPSFGAWFSLIETIGNDAMSPLFDATILATEEAVINALVASDTMSGADSRRVIGLPHDRLREVLRKYNRLVNPAS